MRFLDVSVVGFALLAGSALKVGCGTKFSACEGDECASTGGTGGSAGGLGNVGGTGGSGAGTNGAGGTEATVGGAGGSSGASVGGSAGEGAGGSGISGAGGTSNGCDGELLPGDDACVVDDLYGVFVSPEGDDEKGEGTRQAPYRTLRRATDAAWEADKRVYACATGGAYAERLELGEDHDGLELYGSFDCEDWSYDAELRASVSPESGMALTISAIANSLRIVGFGFESADATEPGGSSIAVFIQGSEGVVLENTRLSAGAGSSGADGETVEVVFPPKSELDGVSGTATAGGVMEPVECPAGGITRGGAGGGIEPTGGGNGLPNHDGPGGEAGVADSACTGLNAMGSGFPGADAPLAADGPGATTPGTLNSSGWTPADGLPGDAGLPGQGGGGGAGAATGGGGSGGAGGCGGGGGAHGRGGGASIALLLLDSQVSVVDSVLASDDAGDGGAGDAGQQGQQERGSFGNGDPDGCPGGSGGLGGNGGNGGGGAGGISAAIAYQGPEPTLSNSDTTAGAAGTGGEGAGADNDGVDGAAEALIEITPP